MHTKTQFEIASQLGIFLLLLMSADAAFVMVHLIRDYPPFYSDSLFSLEQDRGFAEMFQYVKTYWIAIMFAVVWWRTREGVYFAWMTLFAFLLCDDSLEIHERGGHAMAQIWGLQDALGLKAQDFGELVVTGAIGLILLLFLLVMHRRSTQEAMRASRKLMFYLGLLVFFGVFIDLLHSLFRGSSGSAALGVVEDGGEMFSVSIVCWYVMNLVERNGNAQVSLRLLIRTAVAGSRNVR
jgi:hypothetical protein